MNIKSKILIPISETIDKIDISDNKKNEIKKEIEKIDLKLNYSIWLQRNWRPITMFVFLVLIVFDSFGVLKFRLNNEAWGVFQLGIGGYVIGRSVEKTRSKNE